MGETASSTGVLRRTIELNAINEASQSVPLRSSRTRSGATEAPVPVVRRCALRLGRDVEDDLSDVDRSGTVDHRVVGLGEDREASAVEPLDEVHLPERAVAVEGAGHDPADEVAQLRIAPGARERGATYVVTDVELLVVDPHRVGDASRDLAHLLAVARDEGDALLDEGHEAFEVEAALGCLEDGDPAYVHGRGRLLEVEERDVERAQPIGHRTSPARFAGRITGVRPSSCHACRAAAGRPHDHPGRGQDRLRSKRASSSRRVCSYDVW
jgi:hypothetical protein